MISIYTGGIDFNQLQSLGLITPAIMARSFWLSLLLLTSVSALPWVGPQETFSATATAHWIPAPTNGVQELFKRGSYPANLCGWQGPEYQGAYCSTGSSCAWFTDYSVVGCCSIGGYCDAVYTSCIDGDHPPQDVSYPGVYTCQSTDVCYRNTFPNGYHQYGCGSTSVGENVVTSWTGINTQFSIPIVLTGGVLETEAAVTSSLTFDEVTVTNAIVATSSSASANSAQNPAAPTASAAPSSRASSKVSSLSTAGPTPESQQSSKGLPTGGKIAIGVLAAVIAIVAIALIIFCCFFRRRKQGKDSNPFPINPANGVFQSVPPHEEFKSSKNAPVELEQPYYPHTDGVRANPQGLESGGNTYSPAPSYETRMQTPLQSPTYTATLSASSAPSSTTPPTATMAHLPDVYELATAHSARPAITPTVLPELDNPEAGNAGMLSSHGGSSVPVAEGNFARLTREIEEVRAEREVLIRLQQLEHRGEELKEQILREPGRTTELTREMEQVRAEKEMFIQLKQLGHREGELKEQILSEQRRTTE